MWMMITQVKYSYPCLIPSKGCWEYFNHTLCFSFIPVFILLFFGWILAFDDLMVAEQVNICLISVDIFHELGRSEVVCTDHACTLLHICLLVPLLLLLWLDEQILMRWLWRLGNIQAQQTKSRVYLWKSRSLCMPIIPLNRAIWNLFCLQFICQFSCCLYWMEEFVAMRTNKLPLLKTLRTLAGRIEPINLLPPLSN